jgi:GH15 family glucan-1,4-alpha-glucosidase
MAVPVWLLLVGYVALSLVSVAAVAVVVVTLPPRHFIDDPDVRATAWVRRALAAAGRNSLGLVLVIVGLVLSVPGVPGQGLLTILAGTILLDFPGRRRLTRWLAARRGVLAAMNRLRARFGRPPLLLDRPAGEVGPRSRSDWTEELGTMPLRIEDYALVGNCETAALVGRDGSIDWLCVPRFDSPACFAALLGTPEHGRWLLAPAAPVRAVRRRYRPGTLVLETEFETTGGVVVLHDCMPVGSRAPDLVRVVEGRRGAVPMRLELVIRLDYGSLVPWVRSCDDGLRAIGGPNGLRLRTPVNLRGQDFRTVAEFTVVAGQHVPFTLTWYPSHEPEPPAPDPDAALRETEAWGRDWSGRCTYEGDWQEAVVRSLITLKALTYAPTGGLVAAATTSLPERLGGVRNWDYRYCWLRDATFALYALMTGGYVQEARAWREWLVRAVAGRPAHAQILYGVAGDRLLPEWELPWLPGYEGSAPVRVGNAACTQFQLDVYGEVADALHCAR